MRTLSFLVSFLVGCAPVVPEVGGNVVEGQPGVAAAPSDESTDSIVRPSWNTPVSPLGLTGTTVPEWTQTWIVTRLATDNEGNLLVDQPTGEFQPMVQVQITSHRITDSSHNGALGEMFGDCDYVTLWVADTLNPWIYSSDQLRSGVQVIQMAADGTVLGYMQPQEGNATTSLTFERCDGCDPPN